METSTQGLPVSLELGKYDAQRLVADLEIACQVAQTAAQPGPYHDGRWRGISLYSQGGKESASPGTPGLEDYQPTEVLAKTPYFREVLDPTWPIEVVRLLFLPPGATIEEHFDYDTNFRYGLIRLHVPIITHPDVAFLIDGQRCDWKAGHLYYGDFSKPHEVINDSPVVRVHMVIDVELSESVLALFPPEFVAAQKASGIAMHRKTVPSTHAELEAFECRFHVPGDVLPVLTFGKPFKELMAGAAGELKRRDDRLVVSLDGEPAFAIHRVSDDELGIVGLPAGCFFKITKSAHGVEGVQIHLNGVPDDLYSARIGVPCGPSEFQKVFDLPLSR